MASLYSVLKNKGHDTIQCIKNVIGISISSLLMYSTTCQAQTYKKDFNCDGIIDQVIVVNDSAFAFSTKFITYKDGKTKKKFEFPVIYSLGSFFAICNPPNVLGKEGRELLGHHLFGTKDTIDASLNWLIDAYCNKIELKQTGVVDFATKYNPIWIIGEPKLPVAYYSILSNSRFEKLTSQDGDFKSDYFWIDYNPYPHKSKLRIGNAETNEMESIDKADFKVLKIDSTNFIYSTSHGVVVKRQNKYSWVFINDNQIFEANERLIWPSIEDSVHIVGDYILIIQKIRESGNLFVVNPNTGFIIRLNNDLMGLYSVDKIKLNKDNGNVELSDAGTGKYTLSPKTITEFFQNL